MKIEGVLLTPLKVIHGASGSVFHGLKCTEEAFVGFGEAYFSTVNQDEVKGWKQHTQMVSNLVVPVGAIRFVLYDDREKSVTRGAIADIVLSLDNYQRLTIPVGLWMAFQGVGEGLNMLLNISSIPHDPSECQIRPIDSPEIPFQSW